MTAAHHELDDLTLLRAFQQGDHDAFDALFTRHRDRLWAVALRTTGNPEDAADALQEALIAAYRRAGGFRGEAAVTTWLHRIVVNASLDRLRRNKVRAVQPLPDDLEEYAARGAVLATEKTGDDPEAAALSGERRAVVLDALEQLPPDQRAALVLVDMEGYPVDEAAAILECPVGTVKSRCSRGRTRMARLLHERGLVPGAAAPGTGAGTAASHSRGAPPGDPRPETRPETRPEIRPEPEPGDSRDEPVEGGAPA